MNKIAAAAAVGALTAGVAVVSLPADATIYAAKPTLCQILGATHNAPVYVRGADKRYPVAFYVKAAGAVPTGSLHFYFSGAANAGYARPLVNGYVMWRQPVNAGKLTIKMGYGGNTGFRSCSATFTTTIK